VNGLLLIGGWIDDACVDMAMQLVLMAVDDEPHALERVAQELRKRYGQDAAVALAAWTIVRRT